MPSFPDPITDLINRILTVDPKLRITIEEIKHHPAFRIGLPTEYIVPTPFPIPQLSSPIYPVPEDENALLSLQQIGFKDQDELLKELGSPYPNMTKVFFLMLTKVFDPSNLPWDNIQESNQDDLIFVHPFVFPIDFEAPSYDPFTEPSSPTCDLMPSSYVSHSSWLPQPYQPIYEQARTIHRISIRLPDMMTMLQEFLNEKNYQWFHPNAQTLVARDNKEKSYITLDATFASPQIISLDVKMSQGTETAFDELFNLLRSLFTNYIIIDDDIPLNETNTLIKTGPNALDTGGENSCNPE